MEWAFKGPHTLQERLGGRLDCAAIAAMSPDDAHGGVRGQAGAAPLPRARWRRARTRCATTLVDEYGGDAASASGRTPSRATSCSRGCARCPGFGEEKSKIFLALLGKRLGVAPDGLGAGRRCRSPTRRSARSPTSTRPRRSPRCARGRRPRRRREVQGTEHPSVDPGPGAEVGYAGVQAAPVLAGLPRLLRTLRGPRPRRRGRPPPPPDDGGRPTRDP